ncbi:hypothetical protein F5Y02DRAFT_432158 [Annulohypoxylon stygium]|nr:hypothetical protein F5Y02DRAFT_432158 [Annulohypoxylon stygium]
MDLDLRHPTMQIAKFPLLQLSPCLVRQLCEAFLPVEGPFLTIRDHEDAEDGFEALACLARTCKALHCLVTPFLNEKRPFKQPFMGIIPYARTILLDEQIAQRERQFTMTPSQTFGTLEPGDAGLLFSRWQSLNLTRPNFVNDIQYYVFHRGFKKSTRPRFYRIRCDITLLLLSNIPNITSATIDCVHPPLPAQVTTSLVLNSLKGLTLISVKNHFGTTTQHMNGLDLANYDPYFHAASNLETLEIRDMESCSHTLSNLLRLSSIIFVNCTMGTAAMAGVLGSPGLRLRYFVYLTGYYDHYLQKMLPARGQEMYPNDLVNPLKGGNTRDRLTTFVVDLRERGDLSKIKRSGHLWYQAMDHNAGSHFITSLKDFSVLRQVVITQQCLWEPYYNLVTGFKKDMTPRRPERLIDLLPESVELFTLGDVTLEFMSAILSLASVVNSKERFTHLKQVNLYPHPNFIRQIIHAKAHVDDPDLPTSNSRNAKCIIHSELSAQRETILELFRLAGVEAKFPMEVYPLPTDDEGDLERQRHFGHWCHKCHFHGDTLAIVQWGSVGKGKCASGYGTKPFHI